MYSELSEYPGSRGSQPRESRFAKLFGLDLELRRLGRLENLSRRVLGKLALQWCQIRAHSRLGQARLGDYTKSHFGLSRSAFSELAKIEKRLAALPSIAGAFDAGRLSWSKLEIVVAMAGPESEAELVAFAERATVRQLEQELRRARNACVDDTQDKGERWQNFSRRVQPLVRAKFERAIEHCRTTAGARHARWRAIDWIAADFLAGVHPLRGSEWTERLEEYDWKQGLHGAAQPLTPALPSQAPRAPSEGRGQAPPLQFVHDHRELSDEETFYDFARRDLEETSGGWSLLDWAIPRAELPPEITELGEGVDEATPHELHARILKVLRYLQQVESETAPLLRHFHAAGGTEALAFFDCRHYLEQRAGLPARAFWRFAQLSRWARRSPELSSAWARGEIHAGHAKQIDRVLGTLPEQPWIRRAQQTHLPRFELELILALCGRLEAMRCSTKIELLWFRAPESVIWHWMAALKEAEYIAPPGACAVELVLDSFLSQPLEKIGREHRIFERDDWRCQAPNCFARANLQAHHVVFRSRGGGDEPDNLVSLCWSCHSHGIHEGRLKVSGKAPADLTWEVGCRPEGPPLQVYSGFSLAAPAGLESLLDRVCGVETERG